ncbi:hypothetical protein ACFL0X_02490 [Nanoarchaeota archaeon]
MIVPGLLERIAPGFGFGNLLYSEEWHGPTYLLIRENCCKTCRAPTVDQAILRFFTKGEGTVSLAQTYIRNNGHSIPDIHDRIIHLASQGLLELIKFEIKDGRKTSTRVDSYDPASLSFRKGYSSEIIVLPCHE